MLYYQVFVTEWGIWWPLHIFGHNIFWQRIVVNNLIFRASFHRQFNVGFWGDERFFLDKNESFMISDIWHKKSLYGHLTIDEIGETRLEEVSPCEFSIFLSMTSWWVRQNILAISQKPSVGDPPDHVLAKVSVEFRWWIFCINVELLECLYHVYNRQGIHTICYHVASSTIY